MIHIIAGIIAAILSFVGFIPEARDTILRRIQPSKATWYVWSAEATLLLFLYWKAGADTTLYTPVIDAIVPILMAIVVTFYAEFGWTKMDIACGILAACALGLWLLTSDPVAALLLNLAADLLGASPTILKSFKDPQGENRTAWTVFTAANIVNLFAIDRWSLQIAVLPVYFVFMTGTICVGLYWPRRSGTDVSARSQLS